MRYELPWDSRYQRDESKGFRCAGKIGTCIHPTEKARGLGVGQLQLVEVAKALIHKAQLIVMDEPTSALTDREIERLFDIIRGLKNEGVSFIYISHRLDELFAICDRLTVLRDGEYIGTARIKEISFNQVISMMVGREIGDRFPRKTNKPQDVILEVKSLSRADAFKNIHFSLRKGEILGIAGLMGAGRTELVRSLFGAEPADSGEIILKGAPVHIHSPKEAMELGIGLVTEDRKLEGLFLDFGIDFNMMTTNFEALTHHGLLQNRKVRSYAEELVQALRIKTRSVQEKVSNLSGGNQQKVVVAKWLGREPEILILDEPTGVLMWELNGKSMKL
jgi:ribose transport system ATP-binding protein